MFTNKEQLCQSFWQSVKEQKFKAKKIERGVQFNPPSPLKASRVNDQNYIHTPCSAVEPKLPQVFPRLRAHGVTVTLFAGDYDRIGANDRSGHNDFRLLWRLSSLMSLERGLNCSQKSLYIVLDRKYPDVATPMLPSNSYRITGV